MSLHTEYPFTLPKGYVDDEGTLHRTGVMRLACARDEIEPLRDPRVKENESYGTVIVLARVITELGTLPRVNTSVVERMFASDFAYLQDFYRVINFGDASVLEAGTRRTSSGRRSPTWRTTCTGASTSCSNSNTATGSGSSGRSPRSTKGRGKGS
jgi:hypothetical protein